jgi:hypothetical protein
MRILHRVSIADAAAHLVTVETSISSESPLPDPLELFFAVWTPGSYLVREYARHVENFTCDTHPVQKTKKNVWTVSTGGAREVVVRYHVYCAELTVRTNYVDATQAFLNGAPTFVAVRDQLEAPVEVELDVPESFRVATALERDPAHPRRFRAKSYDVLVDSPIEAGHFREASTLAATRTRSGRSARSPTATSRACSKRRSRSSRPRPRCSAGTCRTTATRSSSTSRRARAAASSTWRAPRSSRRRTRSTRARAGSICSRSSRTNISTSGT